MTKIKISIDSFKYKKHNYNNNDIYSPVGLAFFTENPGNGDFF